MLPIKKKKKEQPQRMLPFSSVVANMRKKKCSHKKHYFSFSLSLLFLLPLLSLLFTAKAQSFIKKKTLMNNNNNSSVTAIFVFGDSTVDPGNNNFINTPFKSNFPPYGENFIDHLPTGRFTNGRLTTDFIVSYMGIKEYVPPYLDPTLSMEELMTGVSFASAGTGYDPVTAKLSSVIEMSKQLDYFKEYRTRMELVIGKKRTQNLMEKAVFVVSAGTNDFIANYFAIPIRRQSFTVSNYQHFLIQHVRNFIQVLRDHGARKIAIAGLPPMGCLPAVITINSNNAFLQRGCIESYNTVTRDYNQMLQNELKVMQDSLANRGARILYVDIDGSVSGMIQSSDKFGFDVVSSGCCGTGLLEAAFMCNRKSFVCSDVSKYVFWDAIHPTEKAYSILFENIRSTVDLIIKD